VTPTRTAKVDSFASNGIRPKQCPVAAGKAALDGTIATRRRRLIMQWRLGPLMHGVYGMHLSGVRNQFA